VKRNIIATTAVLAALSGLAQVAKADCGVHTFTPIDELKPQTRQEINATLAELAKNVDVDWDKVVVGINENNEITLRAKTEVDLESNGSFSCYGAKSEQCDE
jgi:hypothetical protein